MNINNKEIEKLDDKLNELNNAYKNSKFRSVEMAFAFVTAKRNALKARENYFNSKDSVEDQKNNVGIGNNQYNINNFSESLESMEAININSLMNAYKKELDRLNSEEIDKKKTEDDKFDSSKAKGRNFGSSKEKKNDNPIKTPNNSSTAGGNNNSVKKKNSFDIMLENAKITSLSNNIMNKAAMITHQFGREVEFSINENSALKFKKIDGDTYAYINDKQVNKDQAIESLKEMVKSFSYTEIRDFQNILNGVSRNPSIKDMSKEDQQVKENSNNISIEK